MFRIPKQTHRHLLRWCLISCGLCGCRVTIRKSLILWVHVQKARSFQSIYSISITTLRTIIRTICSYNLLKRQKKVRKNCWRRRGKRARSFRCCRRWTTTKIMRSYYPFRNRPQSRNKYSNNFAACAKRPNKAKTIASSPCFPKLIITHGPIWALRMRSTLSLPAGTRCTEVVTRKSWRKTKYTVFVPFARHPWT